MYHYFCTRQQQDTLDLKTNKQNLQPEGQEANLQLYRKRLLYINIRARIVTVTSTVYRLMVSSKCFLDGKARSVCFLANIQLGEDKIEPN